MKNLKVLSIYDLKNQLFYAVVTGNKELEKQVKKEIIKRIAYIEK